MIMLAELIPTDQWRIAHRQVVVSATTVPSEVLVAEAIYRPDPTTDHVSSVRIAPSTTTAEPARRVNDHF